MTISASEIAFQACELFPKDKSKIDGAFTMYSYSRFSSCVILGIAQQMIDDGCSEAQIKEVLASKLIRWGLDADEDKFVEYGKQFARDHNFKEEFKDAK